MNKISNGLISDIYERSYYINDINKLPKSKKYNKSKKQVWKQRNIVNPKTHYKKVTYKKSDLIFKQRQAEIQSEQTSIKSTCCQNNVVGNPSVLSPVDNQQETNDKNSLTGR